MKIGYARVSTKEQSFYMQVDALKKLVLKKYIQKSSLEQEQKALF